MDIKNYISSGILEGYVLGTISDKERKEVECMSHIYEEIHEELHRLESSFEKYALENPKTPSPNIKLKVMQAIKNSSPAEEKKIIPITKNNTATKIIYGLVGAAAGIALIIIIGYFSLKEKEIEIASLKTEIENIQDDYETLDANVIALNGINEKLAHELAMFRSPEFKTVFLADVNHQKDGSLGIICWNKINNQVMIAVENVPEIPEGKQMQLWAIVDGKPFNLGVLPDDVNSSFRLLDTVVSKPDAFAITLENKGGSREPSLDQMMLAGNL